MNELGFILLKSVSSRFTKNKAKLWESRKDGVSSKRMLDRYVESRPMKCQFQSTARDITVFDLRLSIVEQRQQKRQKRFIDTSHTCYSQFFSQVICILLPKIWQYLLLTFFEWCRNHGNWQLSSTLQSSKPEYLQHFVETRFPGIYSLSSPVGLISRMWCTMINFANNSLTNHFFRCFPF